MGGVVLAECVQFTQNCKGPYGKVSPRKPWIPDGLMHCGYGQPALLGGALERADEVKMT